MKKLILCIVLCSHLSIIGMEQEDLQNAVLPTSWVIETTPKIIDQHIQILAAQLNENKRYKFSYQGTNAFNGYIDFARCDISVPDILAFIQLLCKNGTVTIDEMK